MKWLLDEMYSPEVARILRERGHDVSAVAERTELRETPDRVLLDLAMLEDRALVTENVRDFVRIARLRTDYGHAGIILVSHKKYPREQGRSIGRFVEALEALLMDKAHQQDLIVWL